VELHSANSINESIPVAEPPSDAGTSILMADVLIGDRGPVLVKTSDNSDDSRNLTATPLTSRLKANLTSPPRDVNVAPASDISEMRPLADTVHPVNEPCNNTTAPVDCKRPRVSMEASRIAMREGLLPEWAFRIHEALLKQSGFDVD
jgi:hypothetical protein